MEEVDHEEASEDQDTFDYSRVAGGTTTIFIGTILGLALGFLARTIPAQLLGPDQYGLLMLGWTVVSMLGLVSMLGFKDGITRHVPREGSHSQKKGILITAVSITLPWSLLLSSGLLLFAEPISIRIFSDSELTTVIRIFALLLPITTLNALIIATFRGYERAQERVLIKNVVSPGLRVVFISGAVLAGYAVYGAAIGWLAALFTTLLVALLVLHRSTPVFDVPTGDLRHRELFVFSAPLMISGVMGIVLNFGDNFLIGVYLDSSSVGIYDSAYVLGGLVTTGLSIFSYMFLPVFSKLHEKERRDEMDEFYRNVTKWIVSVTLPIYLLFALFPETIIAITFGPSYTAGALVLVLIATGAFINASVGLCVQALVSIGATRFMMLVNIAAALLNLALNAVLIPQLGIAGAAVASVMTTVGYNAVYAFQVHRETGIVPVPVSTLRPVLGTMAVGAVIYYAITEVAMKFWLLPVFGIVLGGSYVVFYIGFGAVGEADIKLIDAVEEKSGMNLSWVKSILQVGVNNQ